MSAASTAGRARRGALAIVGGTAAGQLVLFLAAPLLSRIYPPGVFGPFAVVNAAVLPFATLAALRLDLAIPAPDSDDDARGLLAAGLRSIGVLSILGLVVVLLAGAPIAQILGMRPGDWSLLLWVPVVGGLMGAFTLFNQTAIRARMYGAIARRNLLQALAATVGQIGLGLVETTAHGLAAGLAVGQLVGVVALAHSLISSGVIGVGDRPRAGLLREYRTFPLVMMPSGLVNALGIQAPVILVSALYGATVAGWLGMAQRVIAMPVALIGIALAQVYLGEFGAARRSGTANLERLFLRTSAQLAAVGVLVALVMVVAGPWLFSTVLGTRWHESGVYARALGAGVAAQMVAGPLSQTLVIMGRQVQQAIWDLGRLSLVVLTILAVHAVGADATTTVWALGVSSTITYAAAWLLSWACLKTGEDVMDRIR